MPGPDRAGLHRPSSEEDLRDLVRWAAARGLPVRVHGAGHSVPSAVATTPRLEGTPGAGVDVALDRCAGIEFDEPRRRVTVEAGCHFGADPRDRSGRAVAEAGLCWHLEQRGSALPVVAGVTHQTVAGFLMTGSAGGSRRHALDGQVVGLRLVDARGEVHELSADRDRDAFHAAGVSLGVLGVVSAVSLEYVDRFDVEGEELVTSVESAPFDLFADGDGGADGFLRAAEYARVLWWPQPGVEKVVSWSARAVPGPPAPAPDPYRGLPAVAGSTVPAQAAAGAVLSTAGRARRWSSGLAALYNAFLPDVAGSAQSFRDVWWRGLPMDDDVDERFLPTEFTELWLPAEATGEALRRLRDHYAGGGFAATGNYCVEVYAGAPSPFWLSPGNERPSTRLNFFWFGRNPGDRRRYFRRFWDLLADLDFRLHWGKDLLDPAHSPEHLRRVYPRMADFLELRDTLDPEGVFLSDYWRAHLGVTAPAKKLPAPAEGRAAPAPAAPARPRPKWPPVFGFRPSEPGYAERAEFVFDTQTVMEAPPEAILEEFVDLRSARHWLDWFVRTDVRNPDAPRSERVFDEVFALFTLRIRTIDFQPGRRWLASVDACSLPLATEMFEDFELTPLDDGRTLVRWRIFYDAVPAMRPVHPLARRFFARMFRRSMERLGRYLAPRG